MIRRRFLGALVSLVGLLMVGSLCSGDPTAVLEPSCAPGEPYVLFWVDDADREHTIKVIEDPDFEPHCVDVSWDQAESLWWRCGDGDALPFEAHERSVENLLRCGGRFE